MPHDGHTRKPGYGGTLVIVAGGLSSPVKWAKPWSVGLQLRPSALTGC